MAVSTGSFAFVTKDGTLTSLKSINTSQFNSDFVYGSEISQSYPLTSSIKSDFFIEGQTRPMLRALQNTLNHYTYLSKHYAYSSSYVNNKANIPVRLISIPSIFYGGSIKKRLCFLSFLSYRDFDWRVKRSE